MTRTPPPLRRLRHWCAIEKIQWRKKWGAKNIRVGVVAEYFLRGQRGVKKIPWEYFEYFPVPRNNFLRNF
jgi:hypothetical protein